MKNLILGIETSCDDTGIAVLNLNEEVIFEEKLSQDEDHKKFGGVVPEIASRKHAENIQKLLKNLKNKINLSNLVAISATCGPGLIGSLITGIMPAKALSIALNIPFIAINHLEGHILSAMIEYNNEIKIEYPFLFVLASGGHSLIMIANEFQKYEILGTTLDDAAGEAFDKIAKMLKLQMPLAQNLEKLAQKSNFSNIKFKSGIINNKTMDFSFSGLKTQIIRFYQEQEKLNNINEIMLANIAFASQQAIIDTLIFKTQMAIEKYQHLKHLIICGGCIANETLKQHFQKLCEKFQIKLYYPSNKYATDNATMIAKVGVKKFKLQQFDSLNFAPKTKWPL